MVAKVIGTLVLVLALSACGKFTLGESEEDISTEKLMGGCKLDRPIPLDNEDLLKGLTLHDARIDPAATAFPKTGLKIVFFELNENDRPNGLLGGRLESGFDSRGFASEYGTGFRITGKKHAVNAARVYETKLIVEETHIQNRVTVVIKDKAIQGIQFEFEPPIPFLREKVRNPNEVVCVKSVAR